MSEFEKNVAKRKRQWTGYCDDAISIDIEIFFKKYLEILPPSTKFRATHTDYFMMIDFETSQQDPRRIKWLPLHLDYKAMCCNYDPKKFAICLLTEGYDIIAKTPERKYKLMLGGQK